MLSSFLGDGTEGKSGGRGGGTGAGPGGAAGVRSPLWSGGQGGVFSLGWDVIDSREELSQ